MRELGFSEHWPKLQQSEFTTWRFRRHDKDWQVGERVRVVYKPRSKERDFMFYGEIVGKERRHLKDYGQREVDNLRTENLSVDKLTNGVTLEEARADGFASVVDMLAWFRTVHGERVDREPINKLTVRHAQLLV